MPQAVTSQDMAGHLSSSLPYPRARLVARRLRTPSGCPFEGAPGTGEYPEETCGALECAPLRAPT